MFVAVFFFFFKQKTAYEISACLVGSEMCIRDSYLERKPVENDRRKTELVCTKKAGTVIERGRRIQQQFTANLFAGIDEEQKKQLTIVMEQLENNMDEIIRRKSHK